MSKLPHMLLALALVSIGSACAEQKGAKKDDKKADDKKTDDKKAEDKKE